MADVIQERIDCSRYGNKSRIVTRRFKRTENDIHEETCTGAVRSSPD